MGGGCGRMGRRVGPVGECAAGSIDSGSCLHVCEVSCIKWINGEIQGRNLHSHDKLIPE